MPTTQTLESAAQAEARREEAYNRRYVVLLLSKKNVPYIQIVRTRASLETIGTFWDKPVLAVGLSVVGRAGKDGEDLLQTYLANPVFPISKRGMVCHHSDGQKVHTAICLGEHEGEFKLLVMTTNPFWNSYCRPITTEEAAMTGFPGRAQTYLAPVLRHPDEITWTDIVITDHRIKALDEEFFSDIPSMRCL